MVRAFAILVAVGFSAFSALAAQSAHAKGFRQLQYTVKSGDTLHSLARRFGCTVNELERHNDLGDILPTGKKLIIPTCGKARAAPTLEARMETRSRRGSESRLTLRGGSESTLRTRGEPRSAKKEPRSRSGSQAVRALASPRRTDRTENPDVAFSDEPVTSPRSLPSSTSQALATEIDVHLTLGEETPGHWDRMRPAPVTVRDLEAEDRDPQKQSIGRPWKGQLRSATRLGYGDGYVLRRPDRTYGTWTSVEYVTQALAELRRKFPRLHPIAIGDLSLQFGGPISEHKSHQSGRDVDIGLCFHRRPEGYPDRFVIATEDTLHAAATWAMISAFADTAELDGGVDMMFLDFAVQGMVYRWALAEGLDRNRLDRVFQYPHGRGAAVGLVRHEPHHADHLHIRFRCSAAETHCL
jgi:hypothetical protein